MSDKYFTIEEYTNARCMQMESPLGVALHAHTYGRMCDGCPEYNGGKCRSLRKMMKPENKTTGSPSGETVREEAARRGIGINEVRRQRREKQLTKG